MPASRRSDGFAAAVRSLLEGSPLVAPADLPLLVSASARPLGAADVALYLVDYEQATLVPVHGPSSAERDPLRVDATLAGTAFRRVSTQASDAGGEHRLWVPVLDGLERLGVAGYLMDDAPDADLVHHVEQFTHLVAELITSKRANTDAYEWTRRRRPMELAAEMQWQLLPPLTFGTSRLVISGLLAPAYAVGGDAFDYALNGSIAHVAVFDSMGHGLGAASLAALAVGAYRNARRAGLDLPHTAQQIDVAVRGQHPERFVTAVLGQLDLDTGVFSWLSAGHPAPMLLRGHKVVGTLAHQPAQPLGLLDLADHVPPAVQRDALEPGDRLLLFTDGVDEARGRDGSFFGMQRLAEFVARQSASGEPTPEVMRRLQHAVLEHQQGRLQDDATTLFVEWRTGSEQQLAL